MPPSGRSRYRHAFSGKAVATVNEGGWRGPRPRLEAVDTPAALHAAGRSVLACCAACGHEAHVDLAALVAAGKGARELKRMRPRCTACGQRRGRLVISPQR